MSRLAHLLLSDNGTVTWFKGWDLAGNYTSVDLIAASTNAPNGALLARHPDRPVLSRKLAGKSQREVRDLGLLVENGDQQVVIGAGTAAAKGGRDG